MSKLLSAALVGALAVTACGGEEEPSLYTAADGTFEVLFPGEPELQTDTTTVSGIDLDIDFYVYDDGDAAYLVNQYDYEPLALEAGFTTEQISDFVDLDGAVDGAVNGMNATLDSVENITVDGREGRAVEFSGENAGVDFVGYAQIMTDGVELVQVLALGEADQSDDLQDFVQSFDYLTEVDS